MNKYQCTTISDKCPVGAGSSHGIFGSVVLNTYRGARLQQYVVSKYVGSAEINFGGWKMRHGI